MIGGGWHKVERQVSFAPSSRSASALLIKSIRFSNRNVAATKNYASDLLGVRQIMLLVCRSSPAQVNSKLYSIASHIPMYGLLSITARFVKLRWLWSRRQLEVRKVQSLSAENNSVVVCN